MPVISGGIIQPPGAVLSKTVLFTETATAGVYTGSVTVPAGSFLIDVILYGSALWTNNTGATMVVGDAASSNGIFDAIDLRATDLLAGEGLSAAGVAATAGGKAGADLAATQWNRRYLATERVISGIVTTTGATGTAGRTYMCVVYTDPTIVEAATKA